MNSKTVLNKIMALLSKDEVALTYAKLADGTIVESSTFDVGESLDVISEDGTKTPAPDGMHELSLKDESGNENLIKVRTEGGVIVERENVELAEKVDEEVVDKEADVKEEEDVKMAEETESVETIPEDDAAPMKEDDEPSIEIELKKMMEKMAYRIEEMENKVMKMEEAMTPATDEEVVKEEELPKLDGAPIEEQMKFSAQTNNKNYGKKIENSQSSFLSKLYR